jgi:hypothetical protein
VLTVALLAALLPALAGCGGGGGGGGGGGAVKPATSALDEWIRSWSSRPKSGPRPNRFTIPAAPVLELPTVADDLGRTVDDAATTFSNDTGLVAREVKGVFCHWYGWYLKTGTTVPSQEEFPGLLLEYGFGRVFTSPPSQRLLGAVESFRAAIERGQNELEDVRNASIAAACSAPTG